MTTTVLKVDPKNPQEDYLNQAADILAKGGLVILPTETVYGIAANMLNKKTVERLYAIKKRPKDKPFSLHIEAKEKVEEFAIDLPVSAYKLMDKFWPGPLTIILKSKEPPSSIGVRMPDNEIALKVIAQAKVPVICPSANLSGKPAPVDFLAAIRDFNGLVDLAVDSGRTKLAIESSVVDLTTLPLRLLREAAIKRDEIEAVARKKIVLFLCTGNTCRSVMAKGLLEKKLKEQARLDIEVLCAGIMLLAGLTVTGQTRELLAKEGIDVSEHRSQRVTKEMIKKSDIILVMEGLHEERVLELAPEVRNRLFLLKEFAKINDNNLDIADPIGKSREFYAETFEIIKDAIGRISDII